MAFAVRPGQTLLFTGDSITDAGRLTGSAPLGSGYVRLIADLINARYPRHQLNVINTGIGGNHIRDLAGRWFDDVIRHEPDWVSIMIGINDLHRWVGGHPDHVRPQTYARLYDQILDQLKERTHARVVLIEPFYMSTDPRKDSARTEILRTLPQYLRTVHAMARKHRARLLPMHRIFKAQLRHNLPSRFGSDPVHPGPSGNAVIAHAWLQSMGW